MKHCLVLLVMGCGTVAGTHVGPDAGSEVDAAVDSPPAVTRTAIAADSIATFPALDRTFTHVPFASVAYDDARGLAPDTSHFVAPHDGDYQICASVTGPAAVNFELDLFINGAREQAFALGTFVASGCRVARLAQGDVADIGLYQSSGSSQSFGGNPFADWLTIAEQPASIEVRGFASFQAPQMVFVRVPYINKLRDPDNEYDPVSAQFTPKLAGDYEVCASFAMGGNLGFELDLFKNNVRERAFTGDRGGGTGCRVIRLAAGDHLDVRAYQDAAVVQTVPVDAFWDWLSIERVPAQVSIGDTQPLALPAQTFVTVPYATVLYDDDGRFDRATHMFTASHAGDYEVCASMIELGSVPCEIDLFWNSVRYKALGVSQQTGLTASVARGCRVVRLATSDTLDVRMHADTSLTVAANGDWNWLTIREIP